jgi:hypothetical protein
LIKVKLLLSAKWKTVNEYMKESYKILN